MITLVYCPSDITWKIEKKNYEKILLLPPTNLVLHWGPFSFCLICMQIIFLWAIFYLYTCTCVTEVSCTVLPVHLFLNMNHASLISRNMPPFLSGGMFFAKKMREAQYTTMLDPLQRCFGNHWGSMLYLPALSGELLWSASILAALGGLKAENNGMFQGLWKEYLLSMLRVNFNFYF